MNRLAIAIFGLMLLVSGAARAQSAADHQLLIRTVEAARQPLTFEGKPSTRRGDYYVSYSRGCHTVIYVKQPRLLPPDGRFDNFTTFNIIVPWSEVARIEQSDDAVNVYYANTYMPLRAA